MIKIKVNYLKIDFKIVIIYRTKEKGQTRQWHDDDEWNRNNGNDGANVSRENSIYGRCSPSYS